MEWGIYSKMSPFMFIYNLLLLVALDHSMMSFSALFFFFLIIAPKNKKFAQLYFVVSNHSKLQNVLKKEILYRI